MDKLGKSIAINIWSAVISEFINMHLSGNIRNYTRVSANKYGYYVKIYPERYDQYLYLRQGIIKTYKDGGSYASALNDEGGYVLGEPTHHHKNYIDDCVIQGIRAGLRDSGIRKYKISIGMQDGR